MPIYVELLLRYSSGQRFGLFVLNTVCFVIFGEDTIAIFKTKQIIYWSIIWRGLYEIFTKEYYKICSGKRGVVFSTMYFFHLQRHNKVYNWCIPKNNLCVCSHFFLHEKNSHFLYNGLRNPVYPIYSVFGKENCCIIFK